VLLVLGVIYASILVMTVIWLYRIVRSSHYLKTERTLSGRRESAIVPIHILLPVLNENHRLSGFIDYFLRVLTPAYPALNLWIITTGREAEYPNSHTFAVVDKAVASSSSIHRIHYPSTVGNMAHQLNYALKEVPQDGLYAVYNADSQPEPQTFQWVADHYRPDASQAFQQYGLYTKNFSFLRTQPLSPILLSNALWQTRWAIGFEYYRAKITSHRGRWLTIFKPFNYCIGHGLFLSSSVFSHLSFSEDTTNEDAVLGIELAMNGISLQPVPFFDIAESPDSVSSIYQQKSNWFQGPYQVRAYYRTLRKKYADRAKLVILNAKLFTHAIYWLIGPMMIVGTILVSIVAALFHPIYLALILIPLAFMTVPALLASRVTHSFAITSQYGLARYALPSMSRDLVLGAAIAYLVHGAAGIRGMLFSKAILNGKKKKTAMLQQGE